jgi:uncharacterized protein YcfL
MKKLILLILVALMTVGCEKEQRVIHKYEVLLSTKDTMYIYAWYYESSSAIFTSKRTVIFYDTHWMDILRINDPIYIREIK